MNPNNLPVPRQVIAEFCRQHHITEFALFGSVLRDGFRPDSDVDVLVTFAPEAKPGLMDLALMQDELGRLFDRDVDLVEKPGLRNPFRRREILKTMEVVYAS
jgi:predicted nucleotidyltransferase